MIMMNICIKYMFIKSTSVPFTSYSFSLSQFNEQLQSSRELETNQAQLRGQIQEAQKHVSNKMSTQ